MLIGIGFLVFSATTAEGIVYRDIGEIQNLSESTARLRLKGRVKNGSIQRFTDESRVIFTAFGEDDSEIQVDYSGVIPDTFKDRAEVVVSGKYDATTGVFEASELLAKCPSKYQGGYDPTLSDTSSKTQPGY
ncbi:MAG: cytochrome c maturation protein CcmE [Candidatus Lindowbacteria bacterium]|nr:cytochrome c maturation protein CcmE [Candidatus Lindowbacteria bacterium]